MNSTKSGQVLTVDWNQIDVVLLDMDGTLLDLHFDNFFWQSYLPAACALQWQIDRTEAEKRLFDRFRAVEGTLHWYCLDHWEKELGVDILGLKREIQHLIRVRPGAWEFLQFLRDQGKRSVLVTNAHRGSLSLKMEQTGMAPWLDRLISTHDFGYPKEDQRLWQVLSLNEPLSLSAPCLSTTPHECWRRLVSLVSVIYGRFTSRIVLENTAPLPFIPKCMGFARW